MLRQLAGQTVIYGISSIVARLLNYLLVPYLTRIMTTGEYGVVTDMYALIPFVLVLLTMGMETSYFKFAGAADTPLEKRKVYATTWGAVTGLSLLFMAVVLIFTPGIANIMEYPDHQSYIWIMGAIVSLDAITAIPLASLRQQGKAMQYVSARIIFVMVNIILVIFFYSGLPRLTEVGIWANLYDPEFGAGYYLVANLIANVVMLIILYPAYRGVLPRINWSLLRTILIYSLPLLLSGIAGTANQYIDRQMIKYLMPADEAMEALGIYGAVFKIGVILVLFIQMYRFAAEPFFLSNFKKSDFLSANAQALKFFVIVSIAIFLGISLYINVFALLLGADFRSGMYILPILLLANIFSGMTINLSFWYKQTGDTRFAVWVTGAGLLFTFLLSFALIPWLGIEGAAWVRLGCETVMLSMSYYLNNKHFPTPYNIKRIASYFAIGALIYAASTLTKELSQPLMYTINTLMLGLFIIFAIRKEQINVKELFSYIIRRK